MRFFKKLALPLLVAVLCLGQESWQTQTNPPGVDWKGLTGAKKQAALKMMQTEGCQCGCNMKLAECRVKDPACGVSRKLCAAVVQGTIDGKDAAAIKAEMTRLANEPPPVLDEPVKISTVGDPVLGPANARITIIEFSDFQCPYCSKAVAEVKETMRQMPKDVRLIFKQFPLETHSDAAFGAEVALAAQAQGKFWEMHDLLYAGFPDLTRNRIMAYARELKLDMNRFNADLTSHKYKARVQAERQEGETANVEGTPTFYFNGKRYNGTFEAKTVVPLLKKELKN